MRFTLLLFLVLLCILPTDSIFGRRGRSSSFGSSNRRGFFSRSRRSSYGWNIPRNAVKKPGLSKKAKYALFGAGGLAAGVYLGSKLRGYDHMSIRNNNNYNMCPGRHVNAGMSGQYNNFVCPEQPGDFYNNQCCYSNGVGYCCPSSFGNNFNQRAGGIGGSIGGILFLVIIGACIYCLCCKKKSQPEQPTEMYAPDQPNYPNNPPDYGNTTYPSQPSYPVQPPPAYPDQNPTGVYPPAPGYPNNNPPYPSNAPGYPSGNPAPYPTGQPGYPPSNNQAPYPGWNQ